VGPGARTGREGSENRDENEAYLGVGGIRDEGTGTETSTGFRFMILSLVVDSTGSRKGRMEQPHERDAKLSFYGIFELGGRQFSLSALTIYIFHPHSTIFLGGQSYRCPDFWMPGDDHRNPCLPHKQRDGTLRMCVTEDEASGNDSFAARGSLCCYRVHRNSLCMLRILSVEGLWYA
jgi:hypothetical protein